MTDTVKAWIQERRSIHADGTDVLLRSSYELERESGIEEGTDIDAIVDAHNEFPKALTALSKVLELHTESKWGFCTQCMERGEHDWMQAVLWPCPTVRAIEGAINE